MSGGTIKAGDLVMVVKPRVCCGNASGVGTIFRVSSKKPDATFCLDCGFFTDDMRSFVGSPYGSSCEISRLKKIDPPAEGETREAYKRSGVPA